MNVHIQKDPLLGQLNYINFRHHALQTQKTYTRIYVKISVIDRYSSNIALEQKVNPYTYHLSGQICTR